MVYPALSPMPDLLQCCGQRLVITSIEPIIHESPSVLKAEGGGRSDSGAFWKVVPSPSRWEKPVTSDLLKVHRLKIPFRNPYREEDVVCTIAQKQL
jgi:hypothetical protein